MSVFRIRKSQVILGAHSVSKYEPEKQILFIKKEFPYPCYDKDTHEGDLKLLQVCTFDCTFDWLKSYRTSYNLANYMATFLWYLYSYRL